MLWVYDNAICEDLNRSLGSDTVRVIDPEGAVDIIAQIKNDNVKFPAVVLTRNPEYVVDRSRLNFTMAHFGVPAVMNLETNMLYNERVIPVNLTYNLTVLATNTADMDELIKELLFKYLNMFFLTITLPYESKRKMRFGISIDPDTEISQSSGSVEYLKSGVLYQSILPLRCEGCVLVSYTPHRLHYYGQPDVEMLGTKQAIPLAKEEEKEGMYRDVEIQKYRKAH